MGNLARKAAAYFVSARHRAQRRKSPWNLILLLLCLGSAIFIGYGLFKFVWAFHTLIYPEHQPQDFWQAGISFPSFVLSFLMVFSLLPGAIAAGFIVGNAVAWLIPGARRAFEAEVHGYPGTDFGSAMRALFKVTAFALPLGLGVSLMGAYFLESLR